MIKDERRKFIVSVVEIEKFINNIEDVKDKELIIYKEDLISRFLQFIEIWKERGASKNAVIFIIKSLRNIVVRGSPNEKKMDEVIEKKLLKFR